MSKIYSTAVKIPRLNRRTVGGPNTKNVVYGVPGFLVRLVGRRRLKAALTETPPHYRHD